MEPKAGRGRYNGTKGGRGGKKAVGKQGDALSIQPTPFLPERFEVGDEKAMEYLQENGYVVFKEVATPSELDTGISLLWDYLAKFGVDKNDMSTWNWSDPHQKGIIPDNGIGHSEFMWFCRAIPKVKQVYSAIWDTDDLITSFDGVHRPWEHNSNWKYKTGTWYHLDQNGIDKPGKICIQGFLNFLEAGSEDGGLCLVAKSHTIFNRIFRERPELKGRGDWVMLEQDRPLWDTIRKKGLEAIKINCSPGDFVLWDSRIIHSGYTTDVPRPLPKNGHLPLRRIVAYICMTPRERADHTAIQRRIEAYYNGWTTSHWPEDCRSGGTRKKVTSDYKPPELTPEQKALVPILD